MTNKTFSQPGWLSGDSKVQGVTGTPVTPPALGTGIPFGAIATWKSTVAMYTVGTASFSMSMDAVSASNVVGRINAARALGQKLILGMTGGVHNQYKTPATDAGVYDPAKWQAVMNTYRDTPGVVTAILKGRDDGVVLSCSTCDEPSNTTGPNSWGPSGTMTKATMDAQASYVKNIFGSDFPCGFLELLMNWRTTERLTVCDFVIPQFEYDQGYGTPTQFRDNNLAQAVLDGVQLCFSNNILNGGDRIQDCPIGTTAGFTGGPGNFSVNCRERSDQVEDANTTLGSAGCGMLMWRYQDPATDPLAALTTATYANPTYQTGFANTKAVLDAIARPSWLRP